MTLHRQTNHYSHSYSLPALGRVAATHTRRMNAQHMTTTAHLGIGIVSQLCQKEDDISACVPFCVVRGAFRSPFSRGRRLTASHNLHSAQRDCAAAFPVRSRLLREGVHSWRANQDSGPCRGRVRTSEQLFRESSARKIFPISGVSSWRSGPTSPHSTLRSGQGSPSGARSISLTAAASRARVPRPLFIWQCWIDRHREVRQLR